MSCHRYHSWMFLPLRAFWPLGRIVILCHIHPLFKGIAPPNWQRRPNNNLLSEQFAYHSHSHQGTHLAKIRFISRQRSWQISIPNPSPHQEPYGTNLVHHKLCSGQAGNWILVVRDLVCFRLANRMGIQQPDHLIKTLIFKFIVDCIENTIEYWTAITWIEDLLTILHLLLNYPCAFVCFHFILNDLIQLLQCKLSR